MVSRIAFVLALATISISGTVRAEDGAIKQDQQRIGQDEKNLSTINADEKSTREKIGQDKAAGNTAQEKKDKEALRELKRDKREEKKRLREDRREKRHDEKHP